MKRTAGLQKNGLQTKIKRWGLGVTVVGKGIRSKGPWWEKGSKKERYWKRNDGQQANGRLQLLPSGKMLKPVNRHRVHGKLGERGGHCFERSEGDLDSKRR